MQRNTLENGSPGLLYDTDFGQEAGPWLCRDEVVTGSWSCSAAFTHHSGHNFSSHFTSRYAIRYPSEFYSLLIHLFLKQTKKKE